MDRDTLPSHRDAAVPGIAIMLRVAFVYAPFCHQPFAENLEVVDDDFGRLPPISLAYAAAIAERAGHQVTLVDANALGLSLEETTEELRRFGPDVLAFTLSTYMFQSTTRWMGALREALKVPTIAGGINLRLYPEETVLDDAVDYGVLHFGLKGLPALLDALEAGEDPTGLEEVVARGASGEVVVGPFDPRESPFPALPPPARHLLPNERYYSIISQRRSFTVMITSTGCRFNCAYCAIPAMPRFDNPLDRVMTEIRGCVEHHGIREIDFFDADFFAKRARAEELCRLILAADLDLEWSCRARIDVLDRPLLRLARRAGCRKIYIGIETPRSGALSAMRRHVDLSRARQTLLVMREEGIRSLGFFMIGVPGESHRSAIATIAYALRLPLDFAQFSRMIAKPGSSLDARRREEGDDYWGGLVRRRTVARRVPSDFGRISEQAIEAYTKAAYMAFYFRPHHALRTVLKLRSLDEARRGARTAVRMVGGLAHRDCG